MTGMTTLHTNPLFARLAGGTGTPEEDLTGVAAPAPLDGLRHRLVVSPGFGLDAYHGVNHVQVLENITALERGGGASLGAFSVSRTTREGALRLDAPAHAQEHTPERPSIVNGSVAAAVRGEFGDVRSPDAPGAASCSSTRCCPCTSPSTCRASPPAVGTWTGSRTPV